RLAERPRAVVAEVRDREPNDPVADVSLEQRPDDRRLGDVLNAVDVRVAARLRGADVAPPRPLADRVPRHSDELARIAGGEVPVHFGHGKDIPGPGRRGKPGPGSCGAGR